MPMPTPRRLPRPAPLLAAALALAGGTLTLPGCHGPVQRGAKTEPRVYPFDETRGDVQDIQVFREGTRLKLTNTTATGFGPGRLWVNQRFSRQIDGLAVGQSLDLNLYEFVDEFGDKFRAGGFFATDDPDNVVLVQLEARPLDDAGDDARMHGLIVVRNMID